MPTIRINTQLGGGDPPDNNVAIYDNCGCVVSNIDGLHPITQQFIDEMAAAGIYYTAQQQLAINNLVLNLLAQTGAAELSFVTSLPETGEDGIMYILNYKGLYLWNGGSYDYAVSQNDFNDAYKTKLDNAVMSVNGESPDGDGNVTITVSYPVTSVNNKTGDVVINKTDVGLGNVQNVNAIQDQNASAQTANFWITGTGRVNGKFTFASLASAPGTLINGDDWYNSSTNKRQTVISGVAKNIATEDSAVVTGKIIIVDLNAPTATDTRTGINKYSESTPFSTLASANAVAAIGDTIEIRGGTNAVSAAITLNASVLILNNATINSASGIIANDRIIKLINGSVLNLAGDLAVSGASNLYIYGDNTGRIIYNNITNGAGTVFIKNIDSATGTIQATNINIDNANSLTNDNASYPYNVAGVWTLKSIKAINRATLGGIFQGSGSLTLDNCTINYGGRLYVSGAPTITIKNGCKISAAEVIGTAGAATLKMYNSEYTSTASLWQTEAAGGILELINNKITVGAIYIFYSAAATSGIIVNNFSNAATVYRSGGPSPTSKLDTPNYLGISFL